MPEWHGYLWQVIMTEMQEERSVVLMWVQHIGAGPYAVSSVGPGFMIVFCLLLRLINNDYTVYTETL